MRVQKLGDAHRGTFACHGDQHRPVRRFALGGDDLRHFFDHTAPRPACTGDDLACTAAGIAPLVSRRCGKGHHPHSIGKKRLGLRFGRIQPVRRKRPVGHVGIIVAGFLPRAVEILNLCKPRGNRGVCLMIENKLPVRAIVGQQGKLLMKQRQPMLHTGMHAPRRNGIIQRISACHRPEGGAIAGAEPLDRCLVQLEFRYRPKHQPVLWAAASLRRRIEIANGLKFVAKEIKPRRRAASRRVNIQNAAAKGEFARLAHRIRAKIALPDQKIAQPRRTGRITGSQHKRTFRKIGLRRHALKHRIHRGQQNRASARASAALGKTRQRFDALADQRALRRQPVEGKAIPGREQVRLDLRSQPRQPVPHRHHPRIVPGHIDKARAAAKPA